MSGRKGHSSASAPFGTAERSGAKRPYQVVCEEPGQLRRHRIADHSGNLFKLVGRVEDVIVPKRLDGGGLTERDAPNLFRVVMAEPTVGNTVRAGRDGR